MRTRLLKWSMVSVFTLMAAATASATTTGLAPGTICPDPQVACTANPIGTTAADPTFVLPADPGVVRLGIFVVPGDVLLLETSGSPDNPTTWSDVVEFSNLPSGGGSIATTFADAEPVGILVPPGFTPSANHVSLQETLLGDGTDAHDFTTYTAGSAIYQIHSDCAAPACELSEPPETPTPEPSSLLLFGTGLLGLGGIVRRKLFS